MFDDGGTRPDNVQKWNFTTMGRVTSSPAVVNGVVYVGQDGRGIGDPVWCMPSVHSMVTKLWNFTTVVALGQAPQ